MSEIYLGNGSNLTIQTSKNVELRETLSLMVENGKSIDLDVKIIANFENINNNKPAIEFSSHD